jgi:hypothetical protein
MASCTSMGAALSECLLLPIYCLSVSDKFLAISP